MNQPGFRNDRSDSRIEQLRVPPQSVEAEQAVLGGIMLAHDAYDRIADKLSPEDFYRRDHQLIFQAIQTLAEKKRPYDAVTLGEWFQAQGLSEQVAGGAYLVELASTTPSAANIGAYSEIVRDKAVLRSMIEVGTTIVNDGFMPEGRETTDLQGEHEKLVMDIGRRIAGRIGARFTTGRSGMLRAINEMKRRWASETDLLGVTTGMDNLDEFTLGLEDGDLIVLAARPSMGKSALMLKMASAAARANKRPYVVSLEMSHEICQMRNFSREGRVDLKHIRNPKLMEEGEMERVLAAIALMEPWEWWIDDLPSPKIAQLCARIRRMKRQHDIGICYIDYLQFIDLGGGNGQRNDASLVQDVTRQLKALAKELRIPIVLLSQLNRGSESRTDKRPNMADLRQSGAIEQDADIIIFVYREEYYHPEWALDDPRRGIGELILAKQRNGETGTLYAYTDLKHQDFHALTREGVPAQYYEKEGRNNGRKSERGFSGGDRHGKSHTREKPGASQD